MQHQLNISIDQAGLSTIYGAGQSVTLVRGVVGIVGANAGVVVAWQAFRPLQKNLIAWNAQYYCFATTSPLRLGEVIRMNVQSPSPMQAGWLYTLENGQFSKTSDGSETFDVANLTAGAFSFGLAQQAVINNAPTTAPLNACPVLYNETASFCPTQQVSIFLSSCSVGGTIIPTFANALTLQLSTQNPGANLGFNDVTHEFYQTE